MKKKAKIQSLICDLPLNEGGGNKVFDKTGLTLTPAIVTSAELKTFTKGNCVYFAGTVANKITIGKPSILNLTSSPMTISVWCYFTDLSGGVNSGYRYIISDYNAAGNQAQFAMQITNTQKLTFFWANSGTQAPNPTTGASTQSVQTDKWYHLVVKKTGVSGSWATEIYINGLRDGGTSTSTNPCAQASAGNVIIGQAGDYVGTPLGMVGYEQDLKIYNRGLTTNEIMELYIEGRNKY